MPKAREQFAEFLDQDSLDRFGILYQTTSVGLGYGRHQASRRSFSRQPGSPERPPTGTPITPHPPCPPDLPGGRAARLATENHLRGRLPICVTPALAYLQGGSQHASPRQPEGRRKEGAEVSVPASARSASCRYGNINPFIHSTTPVGLALGPDSPGDDERGPGTLGHPADGIPTRLTLLMSAFSLPQSPRPAHAAASTHAERSPTQQQTLLPRLRWCA